MTISPPSLVPAPRVYEASRSPGALEGKTDVTRGCPRQPCPAQDKQTPWPRAAWIGVVGDSVTDVKDTRRQRSAGRKPLQRDWHSTLKHILLPKGRHSFAFLGAGLCF